ncbi:MAG TPA: prepilin peptidase, partial [Desulfobulbus sp.]|nr:prepilin peptidase [Desulfobulbus sp.]
MFNPSRMRSGISTGLRPGITSGSYPERPLPKTGWLEETMHAVSGLCKPATISRRRFNKILTAIHAGCHRLRLLSDTELSNRAGDLRRRLHRHGLTKELIIESFALVRETAGRTLGMRHFDCQLMGGWIMIQGGLAEMETGEGKTLTATLAAATAALAGIPVHVITVNDYLVARDARLMEPVYRALGLSVGTVTAEQDAAARRNGYRCDIAYCTNKQLAFDYLRDRILLGNDHGRMRLELERLHDTNARLDQLFLRGLCFAIVDEADSVLIDEARTPLIISRQSTGNDEKQMYAQAMRFAAPLRQKIDFTVDPVERRIELTERGKNQLTETAGSTGGIWNGRRRREELVCQALTALHL